jgi:hypothetical protein
MNHSNAAKLLTPMIWMIQLVTNSNRYDDLNDSGSNRVPQEFKFQRISKAQLLVRTFQHTIAY